MGEKKNHEVESWLDHPSPSVSIVLLYGPDRGLVSERASRLAARISTSLDDPFSVVRLDGADLDREQGRLIDEARTISMFADRRLVWVRNAGIQKTLAEEVRVLCERPRSDVFILIEAGDLKKGTPLRSFVESSPSAVALPCYADQDRDLKTLVDEELRKANVSILPDARALLISKLGGDRLSSRAEIAKLALHALGTGGRIDLPLVHALGGDTAPSTDAELMDSLLVGDITEFDRMFSGRSPETLQSLLSAIIRHLHFLHLIRHELENGKSAESSLNAHRPPLFFGRRAKVERALQLWSTESLRRILDWLQSAVLSARGRPEAARAIARNQLLRIGEEALRRRNL